MKRRILILALAAVCTSLSSAHAAETAPGAATIIDNRDGTLSDSATGLMWISDYKKAVPSIEEARKVCSQLNYAGHRDWRLPSSAELTAFIMRLRSLKDPPPFPVLKGKDTTALYWTSTEHAQDPKKQGGLVLSSSRPMMETVNPGGNVIIHGGAETPNTFLIPVRRGHR